MDKIPLPTDNIFKFYALFGLLLFVFAIGGVIAVQRSTNDYLYRSLLDIEAVSAIEKPSSSDLLKKQLLERLVDVAKSDKEFFNNALSGLAAAGLVLMSFGFLRWHTKIQPLQDEMLRLQIEKLRREAGTPPDVKAQG